MGPAQTTMWLLAVALLLAGPIAHASPEALSPAVPSAPASPPPASPPAPVLPAPAPPPPAPRVTEVPTQDEETIVLVGTPVRGGPGDLVGDDPTARDRRRALAAAPFVSIIHVDEH